MRRLATPGQRRRSAGMSPWEGFAFIVLLAGYFYIGFNLYDPIWDRWKVHSIIDDLGEDKASLKADTGEILGKLVKRMTVNGIYGVSAKQFKIERTDKVLRITYEKDVPVDMPFNTQVIVRGHKVAEFDRPK